MTRSFVPAVLLVMTFLIGCSTVKELTSSAQEWYSAQQVKWRERKEKEYKQLVALPPAQMIVSSHPGIASCAQASCALFNEAQSKMKAYIAFAETSHEYVGFVNDIQYYVEEEKLSAQEACAKVKSAVLAADAKLPEEEKVWPKILRGYAAASVLGPQNELSRIAALSSRRLEIAAALGKISKALLDSQKKLKKAKKERQISGDDYNKAVSEIQRRGMECSAVSQQLNLAGSCISFMMDQYRRNVELENYAK